MVECSMESFMISEVKLSAFIYRLFHEDFSSIIEIFLSWSVERPNLFKVTTYLHHTLVLCYSVFLLSYRM